MRKLLFSLIALIVVLLGAALIGPSFVDWNKYKPEIAERVKAATGRDIAIGGNIKLSVLPAPTLSVRDVTLANLAGAQDPNMASLKALDVRVALGALLEGRVNVESITLVEPTISLEILKDGRRNWEFAAPAAKPPAEAAPIPPPTPATGGGAMEAIAVGRFSIENGTLIYRNDAAGTVERIEKLNSDLTAESLAGPISAEGDLVARGLRLTYKGDVGRLEGTAIPLHLDVGLPDADAKAAIKGALSAPTADGKVTGTIEAQGSDLSRILAVMAKAGGSAQKPSLPKPLAQKFSAAANISASAKAVALDDVKIQLGDRLASGAVNVVPGTPLRLDVTMAMNSVELDPWLEMANASAPSFGPAEENGKKSDEKNAGAVKTAAPAGFSIPANVAGSFDLAIDTVVYKRDLIRQVKLRAALEGGKLNLKQASASLPGGSSASLAGAVLAEGGKPAFDGSAELSSDNLRALFDWMKIDVSAVPAERLRRFSFRGKVKGTAEQVDVTGVDMRLDTSQMTGGVTVVLRERPAFGARFDIDRLDLDAYLPLAGQTPPGKAGAPDNTPPKGDQPKSETKPAVPPGGANPALAVLKSFDANVQAKIGSLTVRNMQIDGLAFDGTLQNGVLTVRDASAADFGGGSAKLSGTVSGLGDKPAVDAKFDARVKDASRLMRLANHEPPPILAKLGAIGLAGSAKGALDAFSFGAALDAAGGRITAQGTAGLPAGGPQYDVAFDAKHDDLPALVRVFNPEYRPAAPNLGGLALSFHAKGDANAGELADIKGKVGPVSLSGNAKARFGGPRPAIDANLQASEIVADMFLPPKPAAAGGGKTGGGGEAATAPAPAGQHWSKEPFDFSPLKAVDAELKVATPALTYATYKVDKPELQISLKDGILNIPVLKGTMFEGAFDLKGSLDANATPKLSGDVSISKANIHEALFSAGNIDIAQGKLDYTMKANGSGASPFDLVSSLAGNGTMQVTDGSIRGFDLKAVSDRLNNINSWIDFLKALGTSMSGGQTNFSKLGGTFTIDKGVVRTNDIAMQGDASTGKAAGTIDLPAWTIDMKADFTLTQHPDIPSFGMQIVGPLDSPQRKFDTRALEALGVQKGVGTLLKKVLPGQKETAPAAQQPGAQQPPTQEKPLDTLLKKVIPGTNQPAQQPAPQQPPPPPGGTTQPAPAQPATGQTTQQQQAPAQPQPTPQQPSKDKPFENLLKKFLQPDTSQQQQPAQPAPQNAPAGTTQ